MANEYQTTPEIAKRKIASKQSVVLSNTAPIIKWGKKTGENSIRVEWGHQIIPIFYRSINIIGHIR